MSKEQEKILIMGLTNSGKTSIVLSLKKDTNLLSYVSLKPTKGIERSVFVDDNKVFHIWDFGGQEQYRKDYLEKMDQYLIETKRLIYVIDVQDEDNYELSLKYYNDIIKSLPEDYHSISLDIYLHKFDFSFEFNKDKIANLIKRIEEKVPKFLDCVIFKTSIFTVFLRSGFNKEVL